MLFTGFLSHRCVMNRVHSMVRLQVCPQNGHSLLKYLHNLAANHRLSDKVKSDTHMHNFTHRYSVTLSKQTKCCVQNIDRSHEFNRDFSSLKTGNVNAGIKTGFSETQVRHINTRQILEKCPPSVQPYLKLIRFDRPIGTYLLFWPCTWSIGLAATAGHLPDFYLLALFGAGAFFMRGAGCIINDMWDKDFDKKVARTKTRPLASGELTPFNALVMLAFNLSVSLSILLQLNWYSVFLGAASMVLVITYPLAKRFTYWPQIVLGLTFNYGAMLGWCAVQGELAGPILPLYVSCLLWTLAYDTIYAHQDKEDDMLIGVKSTALKFGDQTKPWLVGFSTAMISSLSLTGYLCDQTWPFYTAVAITAAHLAHQIYTVDLDNPDECLKKFKSNTQIGIIMFLGTVLGTLLKTDKDNDKDSNLENS